MKKTASCLILLLTAISTALLIGSPTAIADPTLKLSESSGVAVGQTITVSIEGLPPNLPTVAVGQCKPQITLPTDCHLSGSRMGRTDAQGVWQPNDGSRALMLIQSIGGTDCTTAAGACAVAVTSLTDPSRILASVPLTFGAKETPAPTPVAQHSQDDSDDSNTGVIIGVTAAVILLAAVIFVVVIRRRAASGQ